jgi:hypothetical protein
MLLSSLVEGKLLGFWYCDSSGITTMEMDKWQQAGLLIQPALIRVIDQIRKHLEQTDWTGTYETVEIWPQDTSSETKNQVAALQAQLDKAKPQEAVALEEALSRLPQPDLVYLLRLQKHDHHAEVNLWHLCYRVCFRNYDPAVSQTTEEMQVDGELLAEDGEVDWHRLDQKAQQIVHRVFQALPPLASIEGEGSPGGALESTQDKPGPPL